jgi:hypothetical protein
MLRAPLRLLRIVRPVPAATAVRPPALRRPKSSAAAAAPRDDAAPPTPKPRVAVDAELDDDDDDMEDMFVDTSMGKEWGGPTRGGRMPEPTRFGDWERKGRATDF